jgi:hypothetical protein
MLALASIRAKGHSQRRRVYPGLVLWAASLVLLAGCSDGDSTRSAVHPVAGTIQFRGQPASGAFVTLHPIAKDSTHAEVPNPRASVAADGTFTLTTYDGNDGAPAGDYLLTVQWYRPVKQGGDWVGGPNVLPKKYALPQTSGLRITVAAGENRLQPIQLR